MMKLMKTLPRSYFKENYSEWKVQLLVFFAQIKNLKLITGFEVKVREAKVINPLKEHKQAFGLLVAKEISLEEVYSYQQSQNSPFRNYLINESKSTRKEVSTDADGMAVVWAMPIKST